MRFPIFQNFPLKKTNFGNIATYKKGPFGSSLKKEIFVPKGIDTIKVYEQQNAIEHDHTLERYFISYDYYLKMKSFTVKAGDIIVSCAGTIGEVYTLPSNAETGVINQALMKINPNYSIVDHNYFIYSFEKMISSFSDKYSNGSVIKNIPPFSDLKKYPINLPILSEQKFIANFIEILNMRIDTQKKIIEDLNRLKISINSQAYKQKGIIFKIKDICEIGRGRVISNEEIKKQQNPIYPVFSSQTQNNGIMGYLDGYEFDGEYITWTTDGANAGTIFYHNEKFNCTNVCGTLKVNNKDVSAKYLSSILPYYVKKYVSKNLANPKLMNNTMSNIEVNIIPKIKQIKFINSITSIEEKINNEKSILELFIKQKEYLLNKLFI